MDDLHLLFSAHDIRGARRFIQQLLKGKSTALALELNRRDDVGRTVLHRACSVDGKEALGFVRLLLGLQNEFHLSKNVLLVNAADHENGWTALHRALYFGNIAAAIALLQHPDTDARVKDRDGLTPFELYNTTVAGAVPGAERWRGAGSERAGWPNLGGSDSADKSVPFTGKPTAPHYPRLDLYTWGSNRNFLLGHGGDTDRAHPDRVTLSNSRPLAGRAFHAHTNVTRIAMARMHAALLTDAMHAGSNVRICGYGAAGARLGPPATSQLAYEPLQAFMGRVTALAASADHTVLVTNQGEVYTFGLGSFSQLGYVPDAADEAGPAQHTPRRVLGPLKRESAVLCAASRTHTVISTRSNSLYVWGTDLGQLGLEPGTGVQILPRRINIAAINALAASCEPGTAFRGIAVNDMATCVLLTSGDVFLIYQNTTHRLFFNVDQFKYASAIHRRRKDDFTYTPKRRPRSIQIQKIVASESVFVALSTEGEVFKFVVDDTIPSAATYPPFSSSPSSFSEPSLLSAAPAFAGPPRVIRLWSNKSVEKSAVDVSVGAHGSVQICDKTGHVYMTLKGTSSDFKRTPFIQRAVQISASSSGAFAVLRADAPLRRVHVRGLRMAHHFGDALVYWRRSIILDKDSEETMLLLRQQLRLSSSLRIRDRFKDRGYFDENKLFDPTVAISEPLELTRHDFLWGVRGRAVFNAEFSKARKAVLRRFCSQLEKDPFWSLDNVNKDIASTQLANRDTARDTYENASDNEGSDSDESEGYLEINDVESMAGDTPETQERALGELPSESLTQMLADQQERLEKFKVFCLGPIKSILNESTDESEVSGRTTNWRYSMRYNPESVSDDVILLDQPAWLTHQVNILKHICASIRNWSESDEALDAAADTHITVASPSKTYRMPVHSYILKVRAPKLYESLPEVVHITRPEAMLVLIHYLYTDEFIDFSDVISLPFLASLRGLFSTMTELRSVAEDARILALRFDLEPVVNAIGSRILDSDSLRGVAPSLALQIGQTLHLPSTDKMQAGANIRLDFPFREAPQSDAKTAVAPDVTLKAAGDVLFSCHSFVLRTRSPFFSIDFEGWKGDLSNNVVYDFTHLQPAVLAVVLVYLYCDPPGTDLFEGIAIATSEEYIDFLFSVMEAANELQLDTLKLICSSVLTNFISVTNVCAIMHDAWFFEAHELVKTCLEYIVCSMEAVLEGRYLDDFPGDLIDFVRRETQKAQLEMMPFTRTDKELVRLREKWKAYMDDLDIPKYTGGARRFHQKWLQANKSPKILASKLPYKSGSSKSPLMTPTSVRSSPAMTPLSLPKPVSFNSPTPDDDMFVMDEDLNLDASVGTPKPATPKQVRWDTKAPLASPAAPTVSLKDIIQVQSAQEKQALARRQQMQLQREKEREAELLRRENASLQKSVSLTPKEQQMLSSKGAPSTPLARVNQPTSRGSTPLSMLVGAKTPVNVISIPKSRSVSSSSVIASTSLSSSYSSKTVIHSPPSYASPPGSSYNVFRSSETPWNNYSTGQKKSSPSVSSSAGQSLPRRTSNASPFTNPTTPKSPTPLSTSLTSDQSFLAIRLQQQLEREAASEASQKGQLSFAELKEQEERDKREREELLERERREREEALEFERWFEEESKRVQQELRQVTLERPNEGAKRKSGKSSGSTKKNGQSNKTKGNGRPKPRREASTSQQPQSPIASLSAQAPTFVPKT